MLRVVETMYSYDAWATDRLLDSMAQLSDDEYRTAVASRHGSIRDTFAHLLVVQWRFASWLDGSMSLDEATGLQLGGTRIPTVAAARDRWKRLSDQVAWVVASQSEQSLLRLRQGTLANGIRISIPAWEILLHIVNHNTHTRGQILVALEHANCATEGVDLFGYAVSVQSRGVLVHH